MSLVRWTLLVLFFIESYALVSYRLSAMLTQASRSISLRFTHSTLLLAGLVNDLDGSPDDNIMKPVGPLPSASNTLNFGETTRSIKNDLWIVGTGTLGEYILKMWKNKFPKDSVIAETKSDQRHATIQDWGATARLREWRTIDDQFAARTVVIAIPPSACQDYVEEVHSAAQLWAGPEHGGNLILTSSIGVYGPSNGNTVNEEFRVDSRSKGSYKLLCAEEAVLGRGGSVIRLAGLYTVHRGPHTFWLRKAREGVMLESNADGLVNLLHYEDAAAATIAAASTPGITQKILLATDNEVLTRAEICASALASNLFPDNPTPKFESETGDVGKVCDSSVSRHLLQWEPRYSSFRVFMRRLGGDQLDDVESPFTSPPLAAAAVGDGGGKDSASVLWLPGEDSDSNELF